MTLAKTVDSLDSVDEQYRELYTETDDGFVLDVEGGFEDVGGLRSALDAERAARAKAEKRARKASEMLPEGFDPDRYKELLDAEERRATEQAEKKGEWDKLKSQLQEQHTTQLGEKDGVINEQAEEIRGLLVDAAAASLLAQDGTKGSPTLLLPIIRQRTQVQRSEDGKRRVLVLDAEGERMLSPKGDGTDATLKDLLLQLKDDPEYSRAFDGTGAAGGGSANSNGSAGGGHQVRSKADLPTDAEQAAFINKHGMDAYLDLPTA